jgi:hypothetical protein
MNVDGLTFVLIVTSIIGAAKLFWNYANLLYEVQDLRKKLGKS